MPGPGGHHGGGPGGHRGPGGPGGFGGHRGPGGPGGFGGFGGGHHHGHRPPPPPHGGWGMGHRPYRSGCGCGGCLFPVIGIAALIVGLVAVLIF